MRYVEINGVRREVLTANPSFRGAFFWKKGPGRVGSGTMPSGPSTPIGLAGSPLR
jgi:hypothetical protein